MKEAETERGKNREKGRKADSSPPPLCNHGGEDKEGRRKGSVGPMLGAQLHVNPIIISHEYLN